ncbi:hypothetical protein BGW37DRAFT_207830 [Umbelopsis sp. PMI_123]|nr:hypothetical protein BGW37DRAFT_207830 [Umbelopsis sp. PMI_123]
MRHALGCDSQVVIQKLSDSLNPEHGEGGVTLSICHMTLLCYRHFSCRPTFLFPTLLLSFRLLSCLCGRIVPTTNKKMEILLQEIILHIIDITLKQAVSDMACRHRRKGRHGSNSHLSSVAAIVLTSKSHWHYVSHHPDFARLRLLHFLNGLTQTVGERNITIKHETEVNNMRAWSSSVFDGIAHGDIFFVEDTPVSQQASFCVSRFIFLECLDLWARINSYRIGVYLPRKLKHSNTVRFKQISEVGGHNSELLA